MSTEGADSRSLVVIGASAGGVEALTKVVAGLPGDFPAAVVVVLHIPPLGRTVLPDILARAGQLPARAASDGEPLTPGCIYVAPPDEHVLVQEATLLLRRGPRENGHRPALDPLFFTAADAYRSQAIGVILSGTLDDGAAGLAAIKSHGGIAVVQDPADALYSGMPLSALERVTADHVVPASALGALLVDLVGDPVRLHAVSRNDDPQPAHPPPELEGGPSMPAGEAVGLSCPECGGSLWYIGEAGVERYHCRIGHAYSEQSLIENHGRALEIALWTALRALEERAALMRRMSRRARDGGHAHTAESFVSRAVELDEHAATIREHIVPRAVVGEIEEAAGGQ
jgi:two-component system, chemotaxis family, protein-glutamate methylesterase/glutaminase